jgi:hypothetical protein
MLLHPLTLESEAQQVLDELWSEKLIPFALQVGEITRSIGEFTIHFHDSRINMARVPLSKGDSFRYYGSIRCPGSRRKGEWPLEELAQ